MNFEGCVRNQSLSVKYNAISFVWKKKELKILEKGSRPPKYESKAEPPEDVAELLTILPLHSALYYHCRSKEIFAIPYFKILAAMLLFVAMPITLAVRFNRSNTGTVGLNPTRSMNVLVYLRFLCR
jgi:hypothetical protein